MQGRCKVFYTLGYQRHSVDSMLEVLAENGVDLLIDVRENPVSRKAGFSASKLKGELERAGICYVHYPCLGTPPQIREKYQRTGDAKAALKSYAKYLNNKTTFLKSLIEFASPKRFCLLCLESDPSLCHRGIIADKLAEMIQCCPTHLT